MPSISERELRAHFGKRTKHWPRVLGTLSGHERKQPVTLPDSVPQHADSSTYLECLAAYAQTSMNLARARTHQELLPLERLSPREQGQVLKDAEEAVRRACGVDARAMLTVEHIYRAESQLGRENR